MFSSILPNASSSAKFVQNGNPKVPSLRFTVLSLMKSMSQNPSRFSVRVFRTPVASNFVYPMAAKVDFGYRSVQQSEQQRYVPRYASYSFPFLALTESAKPAHPTSNHNISYDPRLRTNNYAIYPGALNDTYIYEQSTCSEYDTLSTATFSPAMSTDSTLTLRSLTTPEHFLEERARRPATPAVHSNHTVSESIAPPQAISRTTSTHRTHQSSGESPGDRHSRVTSMQGRSATPIRHPIPSASPNELTKASNSTTSGYNGELLSHFPEYAPSTISELEVDQRDKIAKINAEYNAVSSSTSTSYYSNDNTAVGIESIIRRMSMSPNEPLQNPSTRATPSQPLHPNIHFPTKSQDFNSGFKPNSSPSMFSMKDGSPPLVERIPSQVEFPPINTRSGQFPPAQVQDSWNGDGFCNFDHARNPPHFPASPPATNHPFDNGHASRSNQTTYATSRDTTSLNEYRPLPVPPPEVPRQRSTLERRPSVVGPRPDANVLKGSSDVRHRDQTYSYDQQRDVSISPPRGGPILQSSSRELPNRVAMASELRRDCRTPAPRESNDYRPPRLTGHDSYVAEPQPPVEPHSQNSHATDTHLQPAGFIGPTEIERSNDRIRTRSSSFSNSMRPNLPPVNNLGQHLSSPQQYQVSNVSMPDPGRVSEQDKHHTSPPSMQESSVHHLHYVDPEHQNDVRGQAIYSSQPATPICSRDFRSSHRKNLPIGLPSSKSSDRAPSHQTINPRHTTQEVSSSRSRTTYFEVSAAPNGLPTSGATPYDKLFMPVKTGSNRSNSTDQEFVPPEQPTQRRYSDGDQNPPPRPVESSGRSSAPLIRSVRWTENLICPSPVPASQRRKGWFNRRG